MCLVNPLVVFISIWQSFKECLRAAQNALEGRMQPAGRSLPTPGLDSTANQNCSVWSFCNQTGWINRHLFMCTVNGVCNDMFKASAFFALLLKQLQIDQMFWRSFQHILHLRTGNGGILLAIELMVHQQCWGAIRAFKLQKVKEGIRCMLNRNTLTFKTLSSHFNDFWIKKF